jgi:hypothetical protein
MPSDAPHINPFQSPRAELDERTPHGNSEAENHRRRGMRRETTLRALGVVKFASVVFFWGLFGLLWAFPMHGGQELEPLRMTRFTIEILALVLGFVHAGVAVGLWRLRRWSCWAQAASSVCAILVGLLFLSSALFQHGEVIDAIRLFAGMLLLAVHSVLLFLVLSGPAARATSREYAQVIAQTGDWPVGRIVAFKVVLLSILWVADLTAVTLGFLVARPVRRPVVQLEPFP